MSDWIMGGVTIPGISAQAGMLIYRLLAAERRSGL